MDSCNGGRSRSVLTPQVGCNHSPYDEVNVDVVSLLLFSPNLALAPARVMRGIFEVGSSDALNSSTRAGTGMILDALELYYLAVMRHVVRFPDFLKFVF